MVKTILYAICKNEEDKIEKWLNCYKDVDEIVVLDTGSTDKSIELLKKDSRVHLFEKTWDLFNFSEARNLALEKAREIIDQESDSDWIFLSFDFDEYLEEEGVKKLKEAYERKPFLTATPYCILDGRKIPHYSRIHNADKNWHWEGPIHEGLAIENSSGEGADVEVVYAHDINNQEKKQEFYTYLIREWEKRLPENIHLKNYLIDILLSENKKDETLAKCEEVINLTKDKFDIFSNYLAYCRAVFTKGKLKPEIEYNCLLDLYNLSETFKNGEYKSRRICIELGLFYLVKMKQLSINRQAAKECLEKACKMQRSNSRYYYPFSDDVPVSNTQLRALLNTLEKLSE